MRPMLSTTAPVIGGNTIPPLIAATSRLPPSFVCLPNPLSPSVKIVAIHADSKHKTSISMAIETDPCVVMAGTMKTKHSPR